MNVIKLLNELKENFDLSEFYCITIWNNLNELNLQGDFTNQNVKIAEALSIKLSYVDGFIKGKSENGPITVKITLSSK
jgi:hypothetical protein